MELLKVKRGFFWLNGKVHECVDLKKGNNLIGEGFAKCKSGKTNFIIPFGIKSEIFLGDLGEEVVRTKEKLIETIQIIPKPVDISTKKEELTQALEKKHGSKYSNYFATSGHFKYFESLLKKYDHKNFDKIKKIFVENYKEFVNEGKWEKMKPFMEKKMLKEFPKPITIPREETRPRRVKMLKRSRTPIKRRVRLPFVMKETTTQQSNLITLSEMGFVDAKKNKRLLRLHKQNLKGVLDALIKEAPLDVPKYEQGSFKDGSKPFAMDRKGLTCYLIAVLQFLFSIVDFDKHLILISDVAQKDKNLIKHLLNILKNNANLTSRTALLKYLTFYGPPTKRSDVNFETVIPKTYIKESSQAQCSTELLNNFFLGGLFSDLDTESENYVYTYYRTVIVDNAIIFQSDFGGLCDPNDYSQPVEYVKNLFFKDAKLYTPVFELYKKTDLKFPKKMFKCKKLFFSFDEKLGNFQKQLNDQFLNQTIEPYKIFLNSNFRYRNKKGYIFFEISRNKNLGIGEFPKVDFLNEFKIPINDPTENYKAVQYKAHSVIYWVDSHYYANVTYGKNVWYCNDKVLKKNPRGGLKYENTPGARWTIIAYKNTGKFVYEK